MPHTLFPCIQALTLHSEQNQKYNLPTMLGPGPVAGEQGRPAAGSARGGLAPAKTRNSSPHMDHAPS